MNKTVEVFEFLLWVHDGCVGEWQGSWGTFSQALSEELVLPLGVRLTVVEGLLQDEWEAPVLTEKGHEALLAFRDALRGMVAVLETRSTRLPTEAEVAAMPEPERGA